MLHVCLDRANNDRTTQTVCDTFRTEFAGCCAQPVAIGQENTYHLNSNTFNNLPWLSDPLFISLVDDVVLVSASIRPCSN